ncbi:MAG: site-2 protease family protein [Spirulinaceae cyanobacterium]
MNGNIRVGNLFGIPFYINPSWFLVLGLVTLSFGGSIAATFPALGMGLPWLLGFISALLLFASVLAHELGHSFVAITQGIDVKSITLFIFGGLAMLDKESETPEQSLLVAIAGPAVSLLLFGLFTALGLSLPLAGPMAAIVGLLAQINLVLALFNLIPGLPLDGGNILKSIVWKVTGNPNTGLLFASRAGQVLGWVGIAIGLLGVLGITQIGSFWTLLIGFFVLQNAGRYAQTARVQDKLDHYTAADAINPNNPVVSEDLTIREFVNNYVIGQDARNEFIVTNTEGQLLGVIDVNDLKTVATSLWTERSISDLIKPIQADMEINANLSLLKVVKMLEAKPEQKLLVTSENGVVLGFLEKASILNLLEKEAQAKIA